MSDTALLRKEAASKDSLNIDEALKLVGGYKPFQWWILMLMSTWFFAAGLTVPGNAFMQKIPEKRMCTNELISLGNFSFDQAQELSSPIDEDGRYSTCVMYDRNYSQIAQTGLVNEFVNSNETIGCEKWSFDTSDGGMKRTVVTQWNLLCDSAHRVSEAGAFHYAGIIICCLYSGALMDAFGRKHVVTFFTMIHGLLLILLAFTPIWQGFLALKLISQAAYLSPYMWGTEFLDVKFRNFYGSFVWIPRNIGWALMALAAAWLRDWRLIVSGAGLALFFSGVLMRLAPESPEWLLAKNRRREAEEIIKKAARWNRVVLPENFTLTTSKTTKKSTSLRELCKYPKLMLETVVLMLIWFLLEIIWYGTTLISVSLPGDMFISNALFALKAFPAELLVFGVLRWNRKLGSILLLIATALTFCAFIFIPEDWAWAQLTLPLIGSMLSGSAAFNVLILVTMELYPPEIRGKIAAAGLICQSLADIVSQPISTAVQEHPPLLVPAILLFGFVSVVCAILVFFFVPDNQHCSTPETLEDMQKAPRGLSFSRRQQTRLQDV